jgi:hypothetical protein
MTAPRQPPNAVGLSLCACRAANSDKPTARIEEFVRCSLSSLPGERFLTPKEVVRRADCHITAIYDFINDRKLATVTVADRLLIAESEPERFIRDWPSRNRGVSARWREYRVWVASRRVAKPEGTQS